MLKSYRSGSASAPNLCRVDPAEPLPQYSSARSRVHLNQPAASHLCTCNIFQLIHHKNNLLINVSPESRPFICDIPTDQTMSGQPPPPSRTASVGPASAGGMNAPPSATTPGGQAGNQQNLNQIVSKRNHVPSKAQVLVFVRRSSGVLSTGKEWPVLPGQRCVVILMKMLGALLQKF